jgi:cyanate lyase
MKKIVRLTENDLVRIVKRVISEQKTSITIEELEGKFGKGSKFCFSDMNLQREIKVQGLKNIIFHKVESGDTYSKLLRMTEQKNSLKTMNPKCDLINNLQAGFVIMMSKLPGQ